jgi:quinoprotein glucose dehydrogenase
VRGPDDLPLFNPPYSHITAIDMNTGDILWKLPIGETPERYTNNPKLEGIDLGDTGTGRNAVMSVTKTMLLYTSTAADGTPMLFFVDKKTGETLGGVEVEDPTNYGMMTYLHEGKQYVVLQTGAKLTALALYDESETEETH